MRKHIFRTIIGCLCILGLSSNILVAQDKESSPESRKFYELKERGLIPYSCEFKLGLHHFWEEGLQKEPESRAYVLGYNGKRPLPNRFRRYLDTVENWLSFTAGLPKEKIVVIDGGYREEPVIELWIVPSGGTAPVPSPTYFPKKRRKR